MKRVFSKIYSVTASVKSSLGKARNYALSHERNILNIFEKGYLELSNNSAERAVKESVMGRKNWLFSSTFEGAQANADIYSQAQSSGSRRVLEKSTD